MPIEADNEGHDVAVCECLDCENERCAALSHQSEAETDAEIDDKADR